MADVLALIYLSFRDAYHHRTLADDALTGLLLGWPIPVLIVLALMHVVSGRVRREIVVSADPSDLFEAIADPQRWAQYGRNWFGRYRCIEQAAQARSGGTRGRARLTMFGLPGAMQWEVIEHDPPHRLTTIATTSWLGVPRVQVTLARWTLQAEARETRVAWEQEFRTLGWIGLGRLAGVRMMGHAMDQMIGRVRADVESSSTSAPSRK